MRLPALLLAAVLAAGCTGGSTEAAPDGDGAFVLGEDPVAQALEPPPAEPRAARVPLAAPTVPEPTELVVVPDDASAGARLLRTRDASRVRDLASYVPESTLVQVRARTSYVSTRRPRGCGRTTQVLPHGGGAATELVAATGVDSSAVSPDGTEVAVLERPGRTGTDCGKSRPYALVVKGAAGDRVYEDVGFSASALVWAPGGGAIAWTRTGATGTSAVAVLDVVDPDATPREVVAAGDGCALASPAWTSDTRLVALSLCPGRRVGLDVLDAVRRTTLTRTLLAKPPAGPVALDADESGQHLLVVLPGADSTGTAFALRRGRLERVARGVLAAQW